MFNKSFYDIKKDSQTYGSIISGIFSTKLTQNDISSLNTYANKIKMLGTWYKEGKITQELYNKNVNKLTDDLKGLSTSAQSTAIQIKTLGGSYADGKTGANEFDDAVKKLTTSQKAASISAELLGVALRTALNIGIVVLINLIISQISNAVKAFDDAIDKVNEAKNNLKDTGSNIKDINEKLAETQDKLRELNKIKNPTLFEKDEIEKLKEYNDELERQLRLEKYKLAAETKEMNENAQKALKEVLGGENSLEFLFNSINHNRLGQNTADLDEYRKLLQEREELAKKFSSGLIDESTYEKTKADYDRKIRSLEGSLADFSSKLLSIVSGLNPDDPTNEMWISVLNTFIDTFDNLQGKGFQTFTEIWNDNSFSETTQKLKELAKQGKLTEETFNNINGINDFKDALLGIGVTDIDEIIRAIIAEVSKAENPVTNTSDVVTSLSERITELKKSYDDAFSNQDTIQKAFDKIQEGTSLTSDEMLKLIEVCGGVFPEIGSLFKKTADGYTISADDLIKVNDAIIKSAKDVIQTDKETIENRQKAIEAQLNNPLANDSRFADTFKALRKEYAENENQLKALDLILSAFGLTVSDTTEKISAYDDALKYTQTLNKMLGSLDTANSLLSNWTDTDQWKKEFSDVVDAIVEAFPNDSRIKRAAQKWFGDQTKDSAQALIDEYARAYEIDLDNFNEYNGNKLVNELADNEEAWNDFIKENTAFVDGFKTAYETDLSNFGTYAAAREELIKQLSEEEDPWSMQRILDEFDEKFKSSIGGIFKPFNPNTSGNSSGTDDTDKQYNKKLDKLKKASDGTQKAEEELIQNWINLNDTFYATSDPDKWAENYDTIGDYAQKFYKDLLDKGILNVDQYKDKINTFFEKMKAKGVDLGQSWLANALGSVSVDDAMSSWDLENGYDSDESKNDFELRQKRIDEFRNQVIKAYGVDGVNNVKAYTDAMKDADEQQQKLNEDTYAKTKEDLSADGDRLLDDVLADADKLSEKNIELFSDDPKTFKENAENILDAVSKSAQDALERGLISSKKFKEIIDKYSVGISSGLIQDIYDDAFETIVDKAKDNLDTLNSTPDEYFKLIDEWGKKLNIADDVIQKYKDAVSESDFLDRWDLDHGYDSSDSEKDYALRADRVKYIYELAEQLYGKNGQKNVKAYNALIKQGLEDEKSIWEDRVNDEKSFWEDRQEEVETYYDTQIDKIKDVQDEENKLKDLEEKRLALIKARQNLENVKNQRNQLIFEGGTFRYDVDQDAVLSAEEELADAIEALRDEELNTQIELLEEQKNNAVEFYEKIIDKIDEYLNKDNKVLNSDSEVLNTILESDTPKANFDIQKFIDGGSNFESLVKALGGTYTQKAADYFKDSYNATLVGKQITPSAVGNAITNNSSTTNNNNNKNVIVNMGDIIINVPENMSKEEIAQYVAGRLSESIATALPKYLV